MNIGIIGVGVMGSAFASHLLKNKFNVYGVEPNKKNAKIFIKMNGILLSDIKELFLKCDFLITSLPSIKSYKDVLNQILKETKYFNSL